MLARLTLSPLWGCAVYVASITTVAQAQVVSLRPPDEGANGAPEHPHAGYAGVKPGGDQAPAIAAKPGSTPATITWPGFEPRPDGSSRVFLQSTAQLSTSAAMTSDKVLAVDLGEVRVAGRTNRYPLFTSFFNTPVTRVEFKRAGKRTVLELTLRAEVRPIISSEQAKSGFYFVYIDFPPGQYVTRAVADSTPPPPAKVDTVDVNARAAGEAGASMNADATLDTSMDGELPPGVAAPKATAKAKTKVRFGTRR